MKIDFQLSRKNASKKLLERPLVPIAKVFLGSRGRNILLSSLCAGKYIYQVSSRRLVKTSKICR